MSSGTVKSWPDRSFQGMNRRPCQVHQPKLGSNRKLVNMSGATMSLTSRAIGHGTEEADETPSSREKAGRGPVPSGVDRLRA
jgi:hypothetical protein